MTSGASGCHPICALDTAVLKNRESFVEKEDIFYFLFLSFLASGSDCQRTVEHCKGSVCIGNKPCVAFPPVQLLV